MRLVYKRVIIVSVSTKKYRKNAGKRAKNTLFVIFLMQIMFFSRKRINKIQAIYYKLRQKRRLDLLVKRVKGFLVRNGQKKKDITCPYCN